MTIEFNERNLERLARQTVQNGVREAQPRLDAVFRRSRGKSAQQIERMLTTELARTGIDWNADTIKTWAQQMADGHPVKLAA